MSNDSAHHLPVIETKAGFRLIDGDEARDSNDIVVEFLTNIVQVRKYECLFQLDTTCDDVSSIGNAEFTNIFDLERRFEKKLFIV